MSGFNSSYRIVGALVVLAGCASSGVPTNRVASTEAAIRAAQVTGVANAPDAALYLHYAELERGEAQRFMSNGDNDRAIGQFRRAEADANLAIALSRAATAERSEQPGNGTVNTSDVTPH